MIAYCAKKSDFIKQCECGVIADELSARMIGFSGGGKREEKSWENSLPQMAKVLKMSSLPDDVVVAAEYKIQQLQNRLDFVITGRNRDGKPAVIIVELKQWSQDIKNSKLNDHVYTYGGGGQKDYLHPSFQALNYANIIKNTYLFAIENDVVFSSCSYLHNMPQQYEKTLRNEEKYPYTTEKSPVFLKGDEKAFADYLSDKISEADTDILFDLDNSQIVSSKELAKILNDSLKGNELFTLDDGQKTSIETIVKEVDEFLEYGEKKIILIKGGPGTGKSVVALNSMGRLVNPKDGKKHGYNVAYFTANAAPRYLYSEELTKDKEYTKKLIKTLFKHPLVFNKSSKDAYDCALIDEAHRLFSFKGGMGIKKGVNLLKKAIESTKVSVFFIDEDQAVTKDDYATIETIKEMADKCQPKVRVIEQDELELTSQFRVAGGAEYISFIRSFLGYDKEKCTYRPNKYEFKVCDTAEEVREWVKNHDKDIRKQRAEKTGKSIDNISGYCRMVAGYCYDWKSKGKGREADIYDIVLDKGAFKAKWNLRNTEIGQEYSWLNDPLSVDEVGCIHTCQGLDIEYCGVIIGKDMYYENGQIKFNKSVNAKSDTASGIRNADDELAERLIRNTYNVLLTRGIKGTYVYCEDKELRDHLRSLIVP
ncbi:MAG: DUF2075 domain-containing protein [Ruminococcus sp.]|nr:DUF2075 domain-containing protein [Ruminococcus sp.]